MSVSIQSLFDSLVPNVYISKITLESGGSVPFTDNPHIDESKDPLILNSIHKDAFETYRSGANPSNSDVENSLRATIEITAKEILNNDAAGTWFAQQDFSRFIKVKVFQSTDEKTSDLLNDSGNIIELSDTAGTSLVDTRQNLQIIKDELGGGDLALGLAMFKENVKTQTLSIDADVLGDNSDLTSKKKTIDEDGNVVFDIVFRTSFSLPEVNPRHLSYYAVSYIDVEAITQQYSVDLQYFNLDLLNGKVSAEMVIDNGQVVSESVIYLTPDDKIWAGIVTKVDDTRSLESIQDSQGEFFISGTGEEEDSVALRRVFVPNNKVQDFRSLRQVEKLQFDLKEAVNSAFVFGQKKVLTNDKLDPLRIPSYFSALSISADPQGTAKMMFSLNYKKLVKENSPYRKFLDTTDEAEVDAILSNTKIRNIKLLRRRIKVIEQYNRLATKVMSKAVFKDQYGTGEKIDVLIYDGETDAKRIKASGNKGSIAQVDSPVNLESIRSLRYFAAEDKEIANFTDGVYQYGVEIELQDSIAEYVTELTKKLKDAEYVMENYLEQASIVRRDVVVEGNPHVQNNKFDVRAGESGGNYDPETDRFTKVFIEKMSTREMMMPLFKSVASYMEILKFLVSTKKNEEDALTSDQFSELARNIYTIVSPRTGTPYGINSFLKLIRGLQTQLYSVLNVQEQSENIYERGAFSNPSGNTKGTPKEIKIKHFFSRSFSSNIPKKTGYEYLSVNDDKPQPIRDTPIRTLDRGEFERRTKFETLKYFNSDKPQLNIRVDKRDYTAGDDITNTQYTFLSPSYVSLGDTESISLLGSTGGNTVVMPSTGKRAMAQLQNNIMTYNALPSGQRVIKKNKNNNNLTMDAQNMQQNNIAMLAPLGINIQKTVSNDSFVPPLKFDPNGLSTVPVDPLVTEASCEEESVEQQVNSNAYVSEMMKGYLMEGMNYSAPSTKQADERDQIQINNSVSNPANDSPTVETYSTNTINNFDPRNQDGFFSWMLKDKNLAKAPEFSLGKDVKLGESEAMSALMSLPNQVKSIFQAALGSTEVTINEFQESQDYMRDINTSPIFDMNYRLLMTIEFLSGYETSKEGEPLIKQPIWEKLTKEKYNKMRNVDIICRLKPYENKYLGLKKPRGLDLPVYDETFIVSGDKTSGEEASPKTSYGEAVMAFLENTTKKIEENDISPEYTTTIKI